MNSIVSTYVQARQTLHKHVQSERAAAKVEGDQVTLTQDVAAEGKTFAKGSTYNLNPYDDREKVSEQLTYRENGAPTVIKHEYDPGRFMTKETLDVQQGFSSLSKTEESLGWKPDGWVQNEVEGQVGFILKL